MLRYMKVMTTAVAVAFSCSALAAVTPEEAKQLGTTLTLWGAIKAGNKEGTIPEYTGPIKPPANYDPKKPGIRPDPFASEKQLLSITAKNMDKYAEKLSEGAKAMLKKYPTFRIDVYPTHRTASYPKYVLDNTEKNATECKTANNGLQLTGCWGGVPFPIPKTGSEVLWNRTLKFEQFAYTSNDVVSTLIDANGNHIVTAGSTQWNQYPHYDPAKKTPIGKDDLYELIRADYTSPARKAGEKIVLNDSVNMVDIGRRVWSYLPGQRRVKLSPDVAYDTPSPTGGGVGTVDDTSLFYGALDRYDFKLMGKKELYIPYNTYKAQDPVACSPDIIYTKNHLNPTCVRWELHRVWVVEAALKPGKRHIYPRRTLYFDEDLSGAGVADSYDSTGAVYRVIQAMPITMYEKYGHATDEFVIHDLGTGAYTRQRHSSGKGGWVASDSKPASFFAAEAMAGSGVR